MSIILPINRLKTKGLRLSPCLVLVSISIWSVVVFPALMVVVLYVFNRLYVWVYSPVLQFILDILYLVKSLSQIYIAHVYYNSLYHLSND